MNKTSNYDFTIVVPVYNEEDNIASLEERLSTFLPTAICRSCVLFVNDGSRDSSLSKIESVCSRHPDFFFISLERNSGLSAAMKAGIDVAESQYVGYIDADLQISICFWPIVLSMSLSWAYVPTVRIRCSRSCSRR